MATIFALTLHIHFQPHLKSRKDSIIDRLVLRDKRKLFARDSNSTLIKALCEAMIFALTPSSKEGKYILAIEKFYLGRIAFQLKHFSSMDKIINLLLSKNDDGRER